MMKLNNFINMSLLTLFLSSCIVFSQELTGPNKVQPGTLAVFEIQPAQEADWAIMPHETSQESFQVDTSSGKLFFATPVEGTYHVAAAIVVDGKPKILVKTFTNTKDGEVKPLPPPSPQPDLPLAEWIKTQLPILVASNHREKETQIIADCFQELVQKIENDSIKTAQNARSQLQITLTKNLAFASETAIDDWQNFLTELSKQVEITLGNKINDINAVKNVFQTVADILKQQRSQQTVSSERITIQNNNTQTSIFRRQSR